MNLQLLVPSAVLWHPTGDARTPDRAAGAGRCLIVTKLKRYHIKLLGGTRQVNMQALVLVSVFRQQTRDRLMEWLEWALPDRVPLLWDRMGYTATPAQMLHAAVVGKIRGFQAGVARRQAAAQLDRRCEGVGRPPG